MTHDDLVFFVSKLDAEEVKKNKENEKKPVVSNKIVCLKNKIEVFRRDSKNLPCLTDLNYDWEETVYLNLILHKVNIHLNKTQYVLAEIILKCS